MKKLGITILALVLFASRNGQAMTDCPKGKFYGKATKSNDDFSCPGTSIIMHTEYDDESKEYNCCQDVELCNSGMTAHFCPPLACAKYTIPVYVRHLKFTFWNMDMMTVQMGDSDNKWLCPKPIGHLWAFAYDDDVEDDFPEQYLPVDFEDMDTRLSTCSSNQACQNGQFCGYVTNLSFDPDGFGKCSNGRKCSRNSQCNGGECTADESVLTFVDKKRKFCYKLPEVPDEQQNVKMVFTMSASSVSLHVCNSHSECEEYCNTELLTDERKRFSGYNPSSKKAKMKQKGICMESRPFAFLFADFFGDNNVVNGGEVGDEVLPYMPINMNVKDRFYKSRLTNCASNKDCTAGHFCDYRYSLLSDKGYRHSSLKYCYTVPALNSATYPNAQIAIDPDQVSLYPCTQDDDCEVGYCVHPASTTWKFAKFAGSGNSPQMFSGLCVVGEKCEGVNSYNEPYKWDMSWGKCAKKEDCVGHGRTKIGANTGLTFESTCISNNGKTGCCYRETKQCKNGGKVVEPSNRCGKSSSNNPEVSFADCYGGAAQLKSQATRLDKWCDLDINQCCQEPTKSFCSDAQTPLFNEPNCANYDVSNAESGTCDVKKGAVCKLGHCCPATKVDSSGNVVKGAESYETNVPCTPGVRPPQFPNGYCDPVTGKVVVIGQNAPGGKPFEHADPANPKVCQTDADCSNDKSTICIFDQPNVAHCFKTPKSSPPSPTPPPVRPVTSGSPNSPIGTTDSSNPQDSSSPQAEGQGGDSDEKRSTYIIVGVLILALILILLAIVIGFIIYRNMKKKAKPVKKGKNKKNGKAKGKDGKKGKGKGKKKKVAKPKTEKSSSQASSSTAMTGSVGGTGTSTGGAYSPAIV